MEFVDSESQTKDESVLTSKEIKKRGYKYTVEPKPPIECDYCGSELYPRGLIIPVANRVLTWIEHERCTCQAATKYWTKYDHEQRLIVEKEKQEEENRKKRERINKILGDSGIEKRFKNRTFENFEVDNENKEAFNNSKLYAEKFGAFKETGEGLYFFGNNGTGKTHLAIAIALKLIGEGVPVICMTSIRLLQEIRRTYDRNRDVSEYQILATYKEVDLLVIDDLGQENITDWGIAMLYDIINDRYERCLPTIVTTNLSEKDLINNWSRKANDWTARAIISRLHEMTMGITVNGRDRRKEMF